MGVFYEVLFLLVLGVIGIVLYLKHLYTFWEKKGVYVSSKPHIIFGNAKPLLTGKGAIRDLFKEVYDDCRRNSQKMSGFYFMMKPCLVLADLDLIKDIMSTDFEHFTDRIFHNHESDPLSDQIASAKGEKWKQLRSQLTPAFSIAKSKMMSQKVLAYTDKLIEELTHNYRDKTIIEISEVIEKYMIRLTEAAIFGMENDQIYGPTTEFEYYLKCFFNKSPLDLLIALLTFFNPSMLTYVRARSVRKDVGDYFLKLSADIIKFREENNIVRDDLIHLLIQLRNNVDINETSGQIRQESKIKPLLSSSQIAANCLIIAIADYETLASAISFCLYELALNPDVQERARREVVDVLALHNGDFCYDVVNELIYVEQCLKESLRKYSPTPAHSRECTKPYIIPNTDILLEPGTLVFVPTSGPQMDPNIFPEPERFDPERFSKENCAGRHPCAWTPFGFGPRMCIGMKYGMMKSKICVAKLLLNFEFSTNHLTEIPITVKPKAFITNSANGIRLGIRKID
ncbi:cytochrome P450 6a2-like [Photinus pyralis]|uniref:cytochrome P450 6a2-like n=1 Tax=Photinus pyralis TaxID=7054 RepID=UPI00126707AC|nr:cytochrome P450 6a2-like [Photinus pyralis]